MFDEFDDFHEIDEEEPLNAKSFTKFVLKFKKLTRIIKRFFIMIYSRGPKTSVKALGAHISNN